MVLLSHGQIGITAKAKRTAHITRIAEISVLDQS